jgi:dihydrofolate reductase
VAKLIYSSITSLDGYIEDERGSFDWATPDEDVFDFVNDLERSVGTNLYGRRMYETMVYWEAAPTADEPESSLAFRQLWQAADKIVYSRSLQAVSSGRTRLEREFDPAAVRDLKAASDRDLTVNGPELAAQALQAGLVDELQLFLTPAVIGGGKPSLPAGVRLELQLLEERRFQSGFVFLRYRLGSS